MPSDLLECPDPAPTMLFRPARRARRSGGRRVADLKLRRDEAEETPAGDAPPPGASEPTTDEVVRATHETLERLDRQMKNLRAIMGETFDGPDGPRAA
jgi:hypothetical protein